jgi:putative DNA primase/helicase
MTAAPYQADARHPVLESFLERVLADDGVQEYAQRWAGYCLTGSTAEEKAAMAYGPTAGGKTTFTAMLKKSRGDYATAADISTFALRRHHDGPVKTVARLHAARLLVSSEVTDGMNLAEGMVKTMTGGGI